MFTPEIAGLLGQLLQTAPGAEQVDVDQIAQEMQAPPGPQVMVMDEVTIGKPLGQGITEARGMKLAPVEHDPARVAAQTTLDFDGVDDSPDSTLASDAAAGTKKAKGQVAAAQADSDKANAEAVVARQGVDTAKAEGAASEYDKYLQKVDEFDSALQSSRERGEAVATQKRDEWLRAADDYGQTKTYDWWGSRNTGGQVLGLISQIFAGAAQGLNGSSGPTPLDRIVERGFQEHQANLAMKQQNVANKKGIYQEALAVTKDQQAALMLAKDVAYDSTKKRIEAMAAKMGGAEAAARAQEAIASLEMARAQNRQKMAIYWNDKETDNAFRAAGLAQQWAALGAQRDAVMAKQQLSMIQGVTGVKGSEVLDETTKRTLATKLGMTKTVTNKIDAMVEQLAPSSNVKGSRGTTKLEAGQGKGWLDFFRDNDQAANDLLAAYKEALNLGAAMSESEKKMAVAAQGGASFNELSGLLNAIGFKTYAELATRLKSLKMRINDKARQEVGAISVGGKPLVWEE